MRSSRQPAPSTRRAFLLGAGTSLIAVACSSSGDDASPTTALDATERTGAPATGSTGAAATEPTTQSTSTEPTEPTSTEAGGAPTTEPTSTDDEGIAALTPAMFEALPICALLPSAAEGPFPSIDPLDRRDISEGYPGHPLRLGLRIVDADCNPVPGAQVDIWHGDASGDYSSYVDGGSGKDEGDGTTFCRGVQTADADGIVEFQTIYPGWYGGRAVHIHLTAHVGGNPVLTSQLYFDEAYTAAVHATGEYAQFGLPDTGWDDDALIGDPNTDGTGIVLSPAPTSLGDGTLGLVNLGIPA